jgi:phosphotransferase family enzyme
VGTQRVLSDQIVAREELETGGASGNTLERVTLRDGRELIHKQVSPEWDWISRATDDHGRALTMWEEGLFARIPPAIDHATVAVEPAGEGWSLFMNDVSPALVSKEQMLSREELNRVLSALTDFHLAFLGENLPQLCTLEDRYNLLSPQTGRTERERGERAGELILASWEIFAGLVPADLAATITALAEDPGPLVEQLEDCEQTLIHGDVRLNNLGLTEDRVVLVDWGERTGKAPAAVELASFLVFDAARFEASEDEVVADFRDLYGERFDAKALDLALIGGLVQLGCNFALPIVTGGGKAARAAATERLEWWIPRVGHALETRSLA